MNNTEAIVEILKCALSNNAIILNNFSYSDDEAAEKVNAFNRKQIEDFVTAIHNTLQGLN